MMIGNDDIYQGMADFLGFNFQSDYLTVSYWLANMAIFVTCSLNATVCAHSLPVSTRHSLPVLMY